MKNLAFFVFITLSFSAYSQKRELIVRASDVDGFPAQSNCFFSNNKMASHLEGLIVQYTCFGEEEIFSELWWVKNKTYKKLFKTQAGNLLTSAVSDGESVFSVEFNEGGSVVLHQHDLITHTQHKINPNFPTIHDLAALSKNHLWLRYTDQNGVIQEASFENGHWNTFNNRGVSYFFGASSNQKIMLQKVRLGERGDLNESQPDEIQIRLAPDFIPQTVLRDRDSDPNSLYLSFRNFSVVQDEYWSVMAKTENGEVLLIGKGLQLSTLNLSKHFREIDFWPWALTLEGTPILRAKNHQGVHALWIIENDSPRILLTLEDTVENAQVGDTLFYNAPLVMNERAYIGVGLKEFGGTTPLGQGILGLSIR
ncbi:MAG: hypothetical protein K2P81_03415 [Bacteriovoracaceae bacterium]|nr:hypothetical protein [Bacteriovoracaceae bacterium]